MTPESVLMATGPIWHNIGPAVFTHAHLTFDGVYIRIFVLESCSDPALPPDIHIRDVLDRVEPAAEAIRALALKGALVTLYYRVFGDVFFEPVELSHTDIQRIAKLHATLHWYASALERWNEISDRLGRLD